MCHISTRKQAAASACRGFTLIELLVTLAVLVVTLGVAVPSFGTFVAANKAVSIKSSFAASIALARSEAARAGTPVILQASTGGSSGNEFANGWDLYVDQDVSGSVSAGDILLRHYEALPSSVKLHGSSSMQFSASGYLTPAAELSYTICRTDGSPAGFSIAVAPSGVAFVAASTAC